MGAGAPVPRRGGAAFQLSAVASSRRKRRAAAGALVAALVLAAPARAADEALEPRIDARIDAFVRAEMARDRIPGVAVAVVERGHLTLARGYGLANVEHGVPVKPETIFESGSIGKQFTAAAVMLLVEDGKLALADPIAKFFPGAPASWQQITVRHLLDHTSGMGDWPQDLDLRRDFSEEDLLRMVQASPLAFAPGERWSYSNLGYVTLGLLVNKVAGKPYGDVLRERVFAPLGMTTARVISEAAIVPDRAAGYQLVDGELQNQEWVSPSVNSTADGSLYLTALDYAKWDAGLDGGTLLRPASLEQIWSPARLRDGSTRAYGFGWHLGELAGHRVAYHGGAWQGFQTFILRFLDDRRTFIVLANLRQAHAYRLIRGVAASAYPELAPPAATPLARRPADETALRLVQQALRQLVDGGGVDPQIVAPDARASLQGAHGAELTSALRGFSVPPAIIFFAEPVGRVEASDATVYRYLLTDVGADYECEAAIDAAGKIRRLDLHALGSM